MTTPTPQCWRPVPSACEINPILSRVCKMGTRGCQSTHDQRAYITDPNMDAAQMNRLVFAVERLAYSLAASGGQLVQESGYGESDIARAALDAARGRVGEAKPSNTKENGA
jgi:hypothetical protein